MSHLESENSYCPDDDSDDDDSREKKNDNSLCCMFLGSTLGWTPDLWKYVNQQTSSKYRVAFHVFIFFVDLADAIFDMILAAQTITSGSLLDGGGGFLGILLLVMTLFGRVIMGLYGRWDSKQTFEDDGMRARFRMFAAVEVTIFYLEDAASILVLANNNSTTGQLNLIETVSMYLTIICALCFLVYSGLPSRDDESQLLQFAVSSLLRVAPAIFWLYLLVSHVLIPNNIVPLSGPLEISAYVVYGVVSGFLALTVTPLLLCT